MSRWLPALVLAALGALLWSLPSADRERLGAMGVHALLDAPSAPVDSAAPLDSAGAPEGEPTTLAARVLAGPHARVEPAAEAGDPPLTVLRLRGVRFVSESAEPDLTLHAVARRAVIQGLRAQMPVGSSLRVEGERAPAPDGANFLASLHEGTLALEYLESDLDVVSGEWRAGARFSAASPGWKPPGPMSVLPALLAIALAIVLRKPVPALLLGVAAGAILVRRAADLGPAAAVALGLWDVPRTWFWDKLTSSWHLQIIGFVVVTMAMIGVITRSGGVRGLVDRVARLARGAGSTQVATWLMGLVIFFDDYANCMLVGTTMRPLSDRYRVSREKLAYLVDSTAAPVAGISILSTWIAYEVSTFAPQLPAAGLLVSDGYGIFLETLPYRSYCLLTLFFAALVAFTRRDLGPMLTAERRARRTGQLVREGGTPMVGKLSTEMQPAPGMEPRAINAAVPLAIFVFGSIGLILEFGKIRSMALGELLTLRGITQVLSDGSGPQALILGASMGLVCAALLALRSGLGIAQIGFAGWANLRSMGVAIVILFLAWMIAAVSERLNTAHYLSALMGESMPAEMLPLVLFLLAAGTAFATGTSWGTMSLLLPLVVGLAFNIGEDARDVGHAFIDGHGLLVLCIGAVLEGSIFGDHCSPISDTTVLSSTASASDHIDHVRTQAPYALLTMAAALLLGYLPAAFYGLSPWFGLALGATVLTVVLFVFGRRSEDAAA